MFCQELGLLATCLYLLHVFSSPTLSLGQNSLGGEFCTNLRGSDVFCGKMAMQCGRHHPPHRQHSSLSFCLFSSQLCVLRKIAAQVIVTKLNVERERERETLCDTEGKKWTYENKGL